MLEGAAAKACLAAQPERFVFVLGKEPAEDGSGSGIG